MNTSFKHKQDYLNSMINNCNYIYKQQVKTNITQFLKVHQFNPIDAVRVNGNNITVFIQLNGFVQIGATLHQMILGIPINFPQALPVFLVAYDKTLYKINNQQQLKTNNQIIIQKNNRGQDYIHFNFRMITLNWKPTNTLLQTFNQFVKITNNPPILVQLKSNNNNLYPNIFGNVNNVNVNKQQKNKQKNIPNNNNNEGIKSQKLRQIVDNKQIQLMQQMSTLKDLQQRKNKIQFISCRNKFLQNHLTSTQQGLITKISLISTQQQNLLTSVDKVVKLQNCDQLLNISEKDQKKLQNIAMRETLKQTQRKLKQNIQNNLTNKNKKYSDYKKIIKALFEKMYQNQSQILQVGGQ